MSARDSDYPDVTVVTMRAGARPQNATYRLMNVLSELTTVQLVTVALSADSKIHDEYEVTEIASGSKGATLLATMWLFLRNQIALSAAVRRTDSPVVYFFGGTAYSLPIAVAKLAGRTVIVQPRGDVPLTLELEWRDRFPDTVARGLAAPIRGLEELSYRVADRIVTYTESMARELSLTRFEGKLVTDGTRYIDVAAFDEVVRYEDRDQRVGVIGRLAVEKGIDELTEAVQLLPDDVEFLFVGDGDRRETVERRLAADIESGRVQVTGWVDHDEIPDYLNRIKLLVLASEPTEGLPTIIQEAFACGTPVYATPVSGIPDVVIEGETGFRMDSRDPEAIATDIESILNRDDLATISENCRAFAVEEYCFEASVERFERLLSNL